MGISLDLSGGLMDKKFQIDEEEYFSVKSIIRRKALELREVPSDDEPTAEEMKRAGELIENRLLNVIFDTDLEE